LCKRIATAVALAAIESGVAKIESIPNDYLDNF
jgi:malate dehydrogenase (oxaloacetate-decarboxylating)(NADP+)